MSNTSGYSAVAYGGTMLLTRDDDPTIIVGHIFPVSFRDPNPYAVYRLTHDGVWNLQTTHPTMSAACAAGLTMPALPCGCGDEYAHRHLHESELAADCPRHGAMCAWCNRVHDGDA